MKDRGEEFSRQLAMELYAEGWDAHKSGEPLSRGWMLSKRQGWQCRQGHFR